MTFINEDFLLSTKSSRQLYHEYACDQPIIDYHNHLSPRDIAENRQFENLFEMWINHDHYKWRAMRANGISEHLITGKATPKEKFLAFAKTVPHTLRNPLYHWTHLELKRFFNIDELLCEENAESIWDQCNDQMAKRDELTTQGILKQFNVKALCTTDDPTDSLEFHERIAKSEFDTKVYPCFRPDWALFVHRPDEFKPWITKLASTSKIEINSLNDLLSALRNRHDFFHDHGARLSDHGCEFVPAAFCDQITASDIFDTAIKGVAADSQQLEKFSTFMLLELARMDAEKNWTNQFHTGVWRNNNTRLFNSIGRDIGCDSMGDASQGRSLGAFLNQLDQEDSLPQTIVYNLNPSDNYLISTMLGNFQSDTVPSKMQFGSGWWYLDQKEGIEMQLNALSNTGLLSRFVGMLTDSRSFMSFTRHEYFRRILCNMLGNDMEAGIIPNDFAFIGTMVKNICYTNVKNYLRLEKA